MAIFEEGVNWRNDLKYVGRQYDPMEGVHTYVVEVRWPGEAPKARPRQNVIYRDDAGLGYAVKDGMCYVNSRRAEPSTW